MTGLLRFSISLRGDKPLIERLVATKEYVAPQAQREMLDEIGRESITILRQYPPETDANRPPPPYYQRGVGYFGRYGTLTKLSEHLGEQWLFESNVIDSGAEGILTNQASYSGYVHHAHLQPPWHRARGWRSVESVVAEVAGDPEADTGVLSRVKNIPTHLLSTAHKIANFIRG